MKNFIYILLVVLLNSCLLKTEEIEFDLNETDEQLLVVEGNITNQLKEHVVKLSLSGKFYGGTEVSMATGATVSISDGTTIFDLIEKEPGIYKTDSIKGEIGKTYTLTIDYNNNTYTSDAYLKSVPTIDNLFIGPSIIPGFEDSLYSILLFTVESPGLGDYYRWNVYRNDSSLTDSLGQYQFNNDDFVDGDTLYPLLLVVDLEAKKGDKIKVEQISISEEAFDIYIAANLETVWRGGIFDSPPSNVPSNISNGALGLWDANAVETAETEVLF